MPLGMHAGIKIHVQGKLDTCSDGCHCEPCLKIVWSMTTKNKQRTSMTCYFIYLASSVLSSSALHWKHNWHLHASCACFTAEASSSESLCLLELVHSLQSLAAAYHPCIELSSIMITMSPEYYSVSPFDACSASEMLVLLQSRHYELLTSCICPCICDLNNKGVICHNCMLCPSVLGPSTAIVIMLIIAWCTYAMRCWKQHLNQAACHLLWEHCLSFDYLCDTQEHSNFTSFWAGLGSNLVIAWAMHVIAHVAKYGKLMWFSVPL